MEITEEQQNDQTIAQKDRPSEVIVEEDDAVVEPQPEPETTTDDSGEEEDDFEELDDTPLINAEKVNWDGEVVVEGEIPWNKKKIGNTNITQGQAAGIGAGALTAIIIGSLVFAFITWRKRKAIAVQARRASTFIVRQSIKARQSIKDIIYRGGDKVE